MNNDKLQSVYQWVRDGRRWSENWVLIVLEVLVFVWSITNIDNRPFSVYQKLASFGLVMLSAFTFTHFAIGFGRSMLATRWLERTWDDCKKPMYRKLESASVAMAVLEGAASDIHNSKENVGPEVRRRFYLMIDIAQVAFPDTVFPMDISEFVNSKS